MNPKHPYETTDLKSKEMWAVGTEGTPKELVEISLTEKNIRAYWLTKTRLLWGINVACCIFFLSILLGV